jgi:hypothetical protein
MTPTPRIQLGAVLEFVRSQFGGDVTEVESNPTIGNAVTDVCTNNGDRVALVIVNVGTQNLFLNLNSGVSSTNGIELSGGGGVIGLNARDDFTLPARNWKGISPLGNTNVYVLEIIRINRQGSTS